MISHLRYAFELVFLGAALALKGPAFLEFCKLHDGFDNAARRNLLQKKVRERHTFLEGARFGREIFLGLTIEGRIRNEAVDEDTEMILDLSWLDVLASLVLVLLLDCCLQVFDE